MEDIPEEDIPVEDILVEDIVMEGSGGVLNSSHLDRASATMLFFPFTCLMSPAASEIAAK